MLILGRKYKFTKLELERLHKKFKSIQVVKYTNREQSEVLKELQDAVNTDDFDMLVLNTKASVGDDIVKYLTSLRLTKPNAKFRIITIEHFLEEFLFKCHISNNHKDLHFLEDIRPYDTLEYILKRSVDYVGVFILLFITWPVLIYVRLRIKKESPGTSMFKQLRVGKNNQEFTCVKFRSMYLDAEANGAQFASQNDPRVFQWGEFMRKTRIDELPQLLNVLRGDMHFIGPRPERKVWTDKFELQIPYYSERHLVKPGITGWAQVMYPYGANAEDAKQKLMYDLYYLKHWSIILECKVIWKTILVVVWKKGV